MGSQEQVALWRGALLLQLVENKQRDFEEDAGPDLALADRQRRCHLNALLGCNSDEEAPSEPREKTDECIHGLANRSPAKNHCRESRFTQCRNIEESRKTVETAGRGREGRL